MTARAGKATQETLIRRLTEDWAKALRARDLDGMMANYAPDIQVFGIAPPLKYKGLEAHRKQWEQRFASLQGPIGYESRDLSISAADDMAFSHHLDRIIGTMKNGETMNSWVRVTVCYRKIDDEWKITHEHVSVPFDMETGKAALDLEP